VTEVSLLSAFAPHLACVAGGVLAVALDAFDRRALAVLGALAGLTAGVVLALIASTGSPVISGEVVLSGRGFSASVALICAIGALVLLGGWRPLTTTSSGGGLAALATFLIAGAAALVVSADVLVALIALEMMALTAYALVWSARTSAATEASMKYFVQGAVATGLLVLGIAILVGLYGGTTSYVWIRGLMGSDAGPPVTTAFVLIAAAFAYKLGAFPFHSWAPDALETAPPHLAALISGVPKLAAGLAMIVLFSRAVFGGLRPDYVMWVFGSLAILSMVFGAAGGLKQSSYTRMLGYSGITQVGYALVGVSMGGAAMTSVAILLTAYALSAGLAFLAAGAFRAARPTWDGSISGLAGLGRERKVLGVSVAAALFSLVGMPLTAGFWGKFLVFGVAASAGYWWLAVIGVTASVVSFGYYGGVLRSLYFESAPEGSAVQTQGDSDLVCVAVTAGLALLIVATGVLPLLFGMEPLVRFLTFA
jgi:NADH-quinone oxidoreductase subunit N